MKSPAQLLSRVPSVLSGARKRPILRWREIPVIIISRDRVTPLRQLIQWLEAEGMRNIIIVDNDSSYPPLLEYLDSCRHTVLRLGRNEGHHSAWSPEVTALVGKSAYIVTDNDVVPDEGAHGAVRIFAKLLNRHRSFNKAGFGLRIDDLPDHYEPAPTVRAWEEQFWRVVKKPGVYVADIDTTFALYRPGCGFTLGPALRTGPPYVAKHMPWYVDSAQPDDETRYYVDHARTDIASWGLTTEASHDYYR